MQMRVTDQFEVDLVSTIGDDKFIPVLSGMIFHIYAPVFVLKEFHKFKYEEQSDHDKEVDPVFYMPSMNRKLVASGSVDSSVYQTMFNALAGSFETSWQAYRLMLDGGIPKELARICLPSSLYSHIHVALSIENLVDLIASKTHVWEVSQIVSVIKEHFKKEFPTTHGVYF